LPVKHVFTGAFLAVVCVLFAPAQAGHELPYYPSFYPQEIRLETVRPDLAATRLQNNTLHAYIGGTPLFGEHIPADVHSVASLRSYLVVTFNSTTTPLQTSAARCAIAQEMLTALAGQAGAYVFHPYPVTPYHADYLQHFDRVEAAKASYGHRSGENPRVASRSLLIRTRGELAARLVQSRWQTATAEWDATLEEVALTDLLRPHTSSLNGWLGPPWLKEGWFHAYLLLAETVGDVSVRQRIDALYRRLLTGGYGDTTEQLNIERTLVALLRQGCERVVVGYAVRHEYFNAEFSAGIENIAFDSQAGFHSPIFLRTVKLKDLPWNGWLRLGIDTAPAAAWNPLAGFSDSAGRFLWYAVGDTALFPAPYSGSWMLNRIADYELTGKPQEDASQGLVTGKP
jgi:hypothetical protein